MGQGFKSRRKRGGERRGRKWDPKGGGKQNNRENFSEPPILQIGKNHLESRENWV